MRQVLFLLCLAGFALPVSAQVQEKKLADRLLRPDLSLANSAQNKSFSTSGRASNQREFVSKSFSTGTEKNRRSFAGSKSFLVRVFGAPTFTRAQMAAASAQTNPDPPYANTRYATKDSILLRPASEAAKKARVREYADQRPFRGQGTRQKILSQQDRPLTVDEVRELLNKNK